MNAEINFLQIIIYQGVWSFIVWMMFTQLSYANMNGETNNKKIILLSLLGKYTTIISVTWAGTHNIYAHSILLKLFNKIYLFIHVYIHMLRKGIIMNECYITCLKLKINLYVLKMDNSVVCITIKEFFHLS